LQALAPAWGEAGRKASFPQGWDNSSIAPAAPAARPHLSRNKPKQLGFAYGVLGLVAGAFALILAGQR
jgi:hypothetical protein